MRRAKIVCTLGPASNTQERVDALVDAGMDCARLNFSHGNHADHAAAAAMVRKASQRARRPLAILGDLCGPKMRVGRFANGPIELVPGRRFTLTTRQVPGDPDGVSVTYEHLPSDVKPGDRVLIDDGLLELRVDSVAGQDVLCTVTVGGTLSNNKGLNLPGVDVSAPALTEKDKLDLAFAVREIGVDYLALSFVRHARDVVEAKALAGDTPLIAKIEKPEAIDNLEAILDAADGAMVARGDLGVELGAQKVPLVQKRIIREVNRRGKLVITATQMLDSMIRNPRPTRAEAADVANAILDGTDAVMLSGESASGRYPVESVQMMDSIVREVEQHTMATDGPSQHSHDIEHFESGWEFSNAAARAAGLLSRVLPLRAIVNFTLDGHSTRLLSEYRPRAPIVSITTSVTVAQRMALEWGVVPRVEIPPEDMEETLRIATSILGREGLCSAGEAFAMVAGWPPSSRTNLVKLHRM